ncbi:MAG TPA: permease [Holophaga sp.]|nr:permease [Holophaga sp.]
MSGTRTSCCGGDPAAPSSPGCGCAGGVIRVADRPGFWAKGGWLIPSAALGLLVYTSLEAFSAWVTTRILHLDPASRLGSAAAFFVYDAPKVLLLLAAVTFLVGFLQSWVSPARTRGLLARRGGAWGNLLASLFGIVTPFCSCSAVPLFIGFVRAGVPLGVTFSYLVAAPMINEVALVLLLALFGWRIAFLYTAMGLGVAFLSGLVLGRMGMERHLEPWVLEEAIQLQAAPERRLLLRDRIGEGLRSARDVVGKVWPYALLGIGVGGFIHGYVPEGLLATLMGKGSWWTVPCAVLVGVPVYASTAVILPIVQSLLAKGAALGTVLAFMMAVTALSLPETIILRKVLKVRLIAVFLGVVALGILVVGYAFNLLL